MLTWTVLRRSRHLVTRNVLVYRRQWILFVSGLFEPLLYLVGLGIGVGALVGDVEVAGRVLSYEAFVAPAMLAAAAMNGGIYDAVYGTFFKLQYGRTYEAVLTTPLGVTDVAVGEVAWASLRGGIYAVAFLVTMAALGLIESPWALLALPAALGTGVAFACVGMAGAAFIRTWNDFEIVMLVQLLLFLFSGTFAPLDVYPTAVAVVVVLTPLYQAVWLIRSLVIGDVSWVLLVPVAYLAAMAAGGLALARRRLARALTP